MLHIRQINSSEDSKKAYVIVITDGWNDDLLKHPSIVDHPDLFEIVDDEPPKDAEYLNYTG